MTNEQQRKMLECAAKACGITLEREISGKKPHRLLEHESGEGHISVPWNPLANPADTAEMCAELRICTLFFDIEQKVSCGFLAQDERPTLAHIEPYGDSRLKAWMYSATIVAAKIGGFEE